MIILLSQQVTVGAHVCKIAQAAADADEEASAIRIVNTINTDVDGCQHLWMLHM